MQKVPRAINEKKYWEEIKRIENWDETEMKVEEGPTQGAVSEMELKIEEEEEMSSEWKQKNWKRFKLKWRGEKGEIEAIELIIQSKKSFPLFQDSASSFIIPAKTSAQLFY